MKSHAELAAQITDRNFRLFAEAGKLHAINDKMHAESTDPFALFREMRRREDIDAAGHFAVSTLRLWTYGPGRSLSDGECGSVKKYYADAARTVRMCC